METAPNPGQTPEPAIERVVERTVELDCDTTELWHLVSDCRELEGWLAPHVDLDLRPGGTGQLTDDEGVVRQVRVDEVIDHERVTFTWWPEDGSGGASVVTLVVAPSTGGSTLYVTEAVLPARGIRMTAKASTTSSCAWGWRLGLLWLRSAAPITAHA
jgi:uncharacterized protein YndB with AHSA1/START domain